MKGLIELSNFAAETARLKSTTLSETEGEGEVKVKIYQNEAIIGFKFYVHKTCRAQELYFISDNHL